MCGEEPLTDNTAPLSDNSGSFGLSRRLTGSPSFIFVVSCSRWWCSAHAGLRGQLPDVVSGSLHTGRRDCWPLCAAAGAVLLSPVQRPAGYGSHLLPRHRLRELLQHRDAHLGIELRGGIQLGGDSSDTARPQSAEVLLVV